MNILFGHMSLRIPFRRSVTGQTIRIVVQAICTVFIVLAAVLCSAAPADDQTISPVSLNLANAMPHVASGRDCNNLLAVRLSLMQDSVLPPLANCSVQTFVQSPQISAFDCTGLTANACAQLYQTNQPHHYMNDGWNPANELWYMPLPDNATENLCLDGTRQFVYADKAVSWQCSVGGQACTSDTDCAIGACEMNDIESDNWVFYTQGGPNCSTAQNCLERYLSGEGNMSTRGAAFGFDGSGILSNHPSNPLHRANRVRLRKCTKDGFMGNTTRPRDASETRPTGDWNGEKYQYDLYFHGYRQWLATFEQLRSGPNPHVEFSGQCNQSSDCATGGECVNTRNGQAVNMCRHTKTLPSLNAAESILLVGWSGGSNALAQTGDHLVNLLQTGVQPLAPNAQVRLAYDAPWKPGLESDTAFSLELYNMYLVPANDIPTIDAPGSLPADADALDEQGFDAFFSNDTFLLNGATRSANDYWNVPLDSSCLATHGIDTWYCHERNHVLANHVTAPVFTRMAQRDKSGKDSPGSNHMHSQALCKQNETQMNCYDWLDEEYRRRTFQQSADYGRDFASMAEEGPGAPNRGVFAPDNEAHNGLESEEQFLNVELMQCREDGVELRVYTLASALTSWMQNTNRINAVEFSEGISGGLGHVWLNRSTCTACPQVRAAQTFTADDRLIEWDLGMCSF